MDRELAGGSGDRDYRTVGKEGGAELTERRSRFLGAAAPVSGEEEAQAFILSRRREFWDASHHVYAYALREGQQRRYSDDGEPQGTAGMPVLETLLHAEATDCVVVVTRYFGGVLLGTGGLVRAYSRAARMALKAAGIVEMRWCARAVIRCSYTQYGRVAAWVPETGGIVEDTRYTDEVEMEFLLPCGRLDAARRGLTEISAGSLHIRVMAEEYVPFSVE